MRENSCSNIMRTNNNFVLRSTNNSRYDKKQVSQFNEVNSIEVKVSKTANEIIRSSFHFFDSVRTVDAC